jgi:hypothetical protein
MTRAIPACVALAVAAAGPAFAEGELTYRARVTFETSSTASNRSSPLPRFPDGKWNTSALFIGAADSTYDLGSRLRFAGGLRVTGTSEGADLLANEAYARFSAASWLDLEAGKRLLRWGVGYGFSPTGVLDPPRNAADPTDRLGLNEGLALARADFYKGDTSLTLAAAAPRAGRDFSRSTPERVAAARLRTVVPGGVEVALVASASPGDQPSFGTNVTHVVGQQLEWHAEILAHDAGGLRVVSGVAGLQYTFTSGVNVVVEYHRHGRAFDREQFLFLRGGLAGTDRALSPELIVVGGLDDGAVTLVPSLTWTPGKRVQVYARGAWLTGAARSSNRSSPWTTALTFGTAFRF